MSRRLAELWGGPEADGRSDAFGCTPRRVRRNFRFDLEMALCVRQVSPFATRCNDFPRSTPNGLLSAQRCTTLSHQRVASLEVFLADSANELIMDAKQCQGLSRFERRDSCL